MQLGSGSVVLTYPIAPENLNLVVWHNDTIEPVACAHNEYEHVSSPTKVWTQGHHEESKKNLKQVSAVYSISQRVKYLEDLVCQQEQEDVSGLATKRQATGKVPQDKVQNSDQDCTRHF